MKTDQLVSALVADRASSAVPLGRLLGWPLAAGIVASLAIFAIEFGPRVDLAAAFATWRFDLKLALVALAFVAAFAACRALARPVPSRGWRPWAVAAVMLAAAGIAAELGLLPRGQWSTRLVGTNALICLTAIPTFALAPLAALLLALRRAAPWSPTLAGAAAGALAWAAAAVIYAFHCFDDSPLFVLTWYPLAAVPVIAVGAMVGRRLLRW